MYKRRIKIFLIIIALVFLIVIARLWYLQVINGDDYRRQARQLLQSIEPLPAMRGQILDRRGRILAVDEPCYDFCLDYRFITANPRWVRRQERLIVKTNGITRTQAQDIYRLKAEETYRLAEELFDDGAGGLQKVCERIVRRVERIRQVVGIEVREQRQFHTIVTGLDEATAVRLEDRLSETVGAAVRPSHKRRYPYGSSACHVIGVTGRVSREELDRLNFPKGQGDWVARIQDNYEPSDTIGKSGIEKMCEGPLRGKRGYRRLKRSSNLIEVMEENAAIPGSNVQITLDIKLQESLRQRLLSAGYNGSIIVLSVSEGEVLALVSVPGYDLNHYRRDYNKLATDESDLPLLNRAVRRCYPPGSTVKPVTALAGLASGVITTETSFNCRGYLYTPRAFRCWIWKYHSGHGPLRLVDAIKHSCNIYFYEIANRLGVSRLARWFEMFGFTDVPGTGLPEESRGTVARSGTIGVARHMAIGQGPIGATPLHVANVMATIGRGGRFLSPVLVSEGGPERIRRELPIDPEHIRAVREGMYKVVNERGGTAYKPFHDSEARPLDVEICGKTGTAETPPHWIDSNRNGRRDPGEKIVYEGDMAWFAGFAPRENPQIAFAVVLEYAKAGGSQIAAPIAREVVRDCQRLGYLH